MSAEYKVHGDVAVITLNNPPVNGLGYETRKGITEALERANADGAVKAIVITGAGKAFSGGADIKEFGTPKALQEPNLLSVILAVENSAKPVVAAMHTIAMGGGLELPLGCHYRIAAPGCKVALPEVKLGLIPGAGGTQRLPRTVGKYNAMYLLLTGAFISANDAHRMGLVSEVVSGNCEPRALEIAAQIATLAPLAAQQIKEVVNAGLDTSLDAGLKLERRGYQLMFGTADMREGVKAFSEKRAAVFAGK